MPSTERSKSSSARERRAFRRLFSKIPPELRLHSVRHFSLRELSILAASPKYVDTVSTELRHRVRDLFLEWDLDAEAMFKIMEELKVVMSGSGALYITAPSTWWPVDLDFYCPVGRYADVVAFFLTQGYHEYTPASRSGDSNDADDQDMDAAFYKVLGCIMNIGFLQHQGKGTKINVIESVVDLAEAPIFLFHSTIVMNTVCSRGVRCFYPEWTLSGQSLVNYASGRSLWIERKEKEKAVLKKYKKRGYRVYTSCSKLHGKAGSCHVCTQQLRHTNEEVAGLTFKPGDSFHSNPDYHWMLGAYSPNEATSATSGAVVIVEGEEGDDVIDGIYGELEHLGKRQVKKVFAKYGY